MSETLFSPEDPLPPLRGDLEIVPIEHEGKPVFLLRDCEADDDKTLALSPGGMAAATLLDGRRSIQEIARLFTKETGSIVGPAELLAVVRQLDAAGLLDTQAARARLKARFEPFLKNPVRKAMLQGRGGYPSAPLELAAFLGGFFRDAKGPGRPLPDAPTKPAALGLVSPHIDLNRGGLQYAKTF